MIRRFTTAALFVTATLLARHVAADEFIGPFPSWKNVKTIFGAVGDGKADDSAALQKALNETQRGVLFLPAGTYRITAGLQMTSHLFVNVIGEDPATTIVLWDGPEEGVMLSCNGVRYSRFSRLTWDGAGKALTAVDHEWDGKTPGAATGNEHSDSVFQDVGFGLRAGRPHLMDAEMSVLRCTFRRCSHAGISIESMNALDWWVWHSLFEQCKVGLTNVADGEYGGGHFHVYQSVFRGSTEADMTIGHTSYFGVRGNTSNGSRAFFIAKRPAVDKGAWKHHETWGAPVMLQDNIVIDPLEEAILKNAALCDSAAEQSPTHPSAPAAASVPAPTAPADDNDFRNKFPATFRTQDGHMVRSRAEVLIDNWLYMQGLVHAYERRLPIEEECYCDFYLPGGKGVYIEFWGRESDPKYRDRQAVKRAIYAKHNLRLIELGDAEIERLDDVLPRMSLRFGIESA